jgi:hypothetical protein
MNRNIVTRVDAKAVPLERSGPIRRDQLPAGPKAPEPDSWYQRVLKYIPGEAIGLYLFLENLCRLQFPLPDPANYKTAEELAAAIAAVHDKQQPWLFAALVVVLVFNWVYLWRVWKVQRISQRVISCAALVVYVYAIGGVFATFPEYYSPNLGMAVLAVGAAFLAFVDPPGQRAVPDGKRME